MVKDLPAAQETSVQSLGQEDPPEMGMATHSSRLAWRIPLMEEPAAIHVKSQTQLNDMTITSRGQKLRHCGGICFPSPALAGENLQTFSSF